MITRSLKSQAARDLAFLIGPHRKVFAFGLFFILLSRLASLVLPLSAKIFIDSVVIKGRADRLILVIGLILLASAVQALCSFAATQLLSKSSWKFITEMRIRLQEHVVRLPISYFDSNRTGVLVSRIINDVEGVRNLLGPGLVDFAGGIITAVLCFILMIRIQPLATLMVGILISLFVIVSRFAFHFMHPVWRQRAVLIGDISGRLSETLSGIRLVKIYRGEEQETRAFAEKANRIRDNVYRAVTVTSYTSMASTFIIGLIGCAVFWFFGKSLLAKHVTLGDYVTYAALLAFAVQPLSQVVHIGTQLNESLVGIERTRELLDMPTEQAAVKNETLIDAPFVQGRIEFQDVSFFYEPGQMVLQDISFLAREGTVTALVGPSGSGKSTIVSLICGFYQPQGGRILLDQQNLAGIRQDSYRSQLGAVLQETFLYDGTIRENLSFARPSASPEEVMEAARIARVDEFVERFPERFETVIGERGIKLSGGQRQRLAIARAILADPKILILDEATSSLDSESEAMIQEALSYLLHNRTTIVIAHRLSTIQQADQILVVDGGQIVERGNHDELLKLKGRYNGLYTTQQRNQQNLFLL